MKAAVDDAPMLSSASSGTTTTRVVRVLCRQPDLPVLPREGRCLNCRGDLGEWAILAPTESRDQHDRIAQTIHPGVQGQVVPRGDQYDPSGNVATAHGVGHETLRNWLIKP